MNFIDNRILMVLLIFISGGVYIAGCTHKNEPVPASVSTGTVKINHGNNIHLAGLTAGDSTQWKLDQVHSNATWSTAYNGVAAPLTGRFNSFGVADLSSPALLINYATNGQPLPDTSWAFYENEPAKTHFAGYVQINTSNTGEPARDGGCFLTTMGAPKIVVGTQNLTVTNVAYIKTTSVVFDPAGNDYLVTFNFTWQGMLSAPHTESITGKLTYIPAAHVTATESYFGLEFQFQFNCRDFGITATDIGSIMTIDLNMNFDNQ
ncbi:hypothetical protein [Mucilaginibacter sp.]